LFGEEITGTKATNTISVLGSSPGEDVGFRDHFSYDIQQYVSNDQAYGKFSSNKDRYEMQAFVEFPAVDTLLVPFYEK
jgi:hypothetical protein